MRYFVQTKFFVLFFCFTFLAFRKKKCSTWSRKSQQHNLSHYYEKKKILNSMNCNLEVGNVFRL